MKRYILQRLLLLLPLLLGITLFTFLMMHLVPGDPVAIRLGMRSGGIETETLKRLRKELGLDDPLPIQYIRYLKDLSRGDMGYSLTMQTPVSHEILARIPATLQLTIATMILVMLVGIPLGVISAIKQGSWLDKLCISAALFGVSMPSFWFGIMLMLLLSLHLGWLPTSRYNNESAITILKSSIMPAVTLSIGFIGLTTRMVRASMLDVLGKDYIRAAYAKGIPKWRVYLWHCLPNALNPVLTVLGGQVAGLLSGAVVVETVFAWPGIGRLAVNAILRRDYPLIIGTVLTFSIVVMLVNLAVDILYVAIDPRIHYNKDKG